jgi:hypothetical protein
MGKLPVRLKEVTYTISPFEVSVLSGLFKDLPSKIHHKFQQVGYLLLPIVKLCLSTFSLIPLGLKGSLMVMHLN